ncbi:MAG TPA: hypothetical protein VF718_01575, partial [Allosphingosinicella sp.]
CDPGERLGRSDGAKPGPLSGGEDQAFHAGALKAMFSFWQSGAWPFVPATPAGGRRCEQS